MSMTSVGDEGRCKAVDCFFVTFFAIFDVQPVEVIVSTDLHLSHSQASNKKMFLHVTWQNNCHVWNTMSLVVNAW